MVGINEGEGLSLDSPLQRKRNTLLLFIVVSIISFSPMLFAGTSYWDIQTGVHFRATPTGGDIDFNRAIRTTQIRVVSSLVEFTSLTMAGDYISIIGMSASSNCDMTLIDIENNIIIYEVTATAGQTSTTRVKVPSNKEVSHVIGASSWSFAPSTNILTVSVIHSSTRSIGVYFNALTEPINETISIIYSLQLFVLVISLLASLGTDEPKNTMMGIIIVNVVTYVLLKWIEGIF